MIKYNNVLYTPLLGNNVKYDMYTLYNNYHVYLDELTMIQKYDKDFGMDSDFFKTSASRIDRVSSFGPFFYFMSCTFRSLNRCFRVETTKMYLEYNKGVLRDKIDNKILMALTIPIKELNIVYNLYKEYQNLRLVYNYKKRRPLEDKFEDRYPNMKDFQSFLDFIECEKPKFTIFVKKEFIKGNNKYKTARKRFKENFFDENKYEQIIVEDWNSLRVNMHYSPYKFKTNNLFEREDRKNQEIDKFKEVIKNNLDILTDEKYEKELFQRKADKLFPYERIFDELKPSTLLLGEDG